jgi:hypothetical protein
MMTSDGQIRRLIAAACTISFAAVCAFSSPAEAAPPRVICTGLRGTMKFSPPLEGLNGGTKHVTKIVAKNAKLTRCTGPFGTTGSLSFTATTKRAVSCVALISSGYTAVGTESIKWARGRETRVALTISPAGSLAATPLQYLRGSVKDGALKGGRQNARIQLSLPDQAKHNCSNNNNVPAARFAFARKTPDHPVTTLTIT